MKPSQLLAHPAVAALCRRHNDHPNPEELVKALCSELVAEGPELPVDLEMLASFRNIKRPKVIAMNEAGSIHFDGTNYVVRLRASDSPRRRRFTLAHEIMHTYFSDSRSTHADPEVGHFDRRDAEEYLCDLGAAELLFPIAAFRQHCPERPSIGDILELAETFDASIEATARRVVTSASHEAHLVVLEPRLSLRQQRWQQQREAAPSFAGLEPEPFTPKLRVRYAVSNTDTYIPPHKSVDDDCTLATVVDRGNVDFVGTTGLVDGREFRVSAAHLPAPGPGGSRVERVIALLYSPDE